MGYLNSTTYPESLSPNFYSICINLIQDTNAPCSFSSVHGVLEAVC